MEQLIKGAQLATREGFFFPSFPHCLRSVRACWVLPYLELYVQIIKKALGSQALPGWAFSTSLLAKPRKEEKPEPEWEHRMGA